MATEYHRPRTGQITTITATSNALLCPDMRDVVSAAFKLKCGGSAEVTLTASLGTATESSLPLSHTWSETAEEAQATGNYRLWAELTRSSGVVVQNEPYLFTIIDDFATISS
jgi:hypothetical protein